MVGALERISNIADANIADANVIGQRRGVQATWMRMEDVSLVCSWRSRRREDRNVAEECFSETVEDS